MFGYDKELYNSSKNKSVKDLTIEEARNELDYFFSIFDRLIEIPEGLRLRVIELSKICGYNLKIIDKIQLLKEITTKPEKEVNKDDIIDILIYLLVEDIGRRIQLIRKKAFENDVDDSGESTKRILNQMLKSL